MKNSIKYYYEELAKELLSAFIDEKFKDSNLADKPDIQSNDGISFGVEVMVCVSSYEGIVEAFGRMYFNKNNTDSDLEKKINAMKLNGSIMRDGSNSWRALLPQKGMSSVMAKKEHIAQCAEAKSCKEETGYKIFNENLLFLFCKFAYNIADIKDIVSLITKNSFDIIFFECMGEIFAYHKNNGDIISYEFLNENLYHKILKNLKLKYHSCFKQKKITN